MKRKFLQTFIVIILISPFIYHNGVEAYTNANSSGISFGISDFTNWFWTDIEVLSSGNDDSFSADMVVDESNNIHMIWEDRTDDLAGSGTDTDVFYQSWNYETETWSSIEIVSTEGSSTSESGKLVVDSQGNIHIAWLDSDLLGAGTDKDVFYRMRSSSGVWSEYTLLSDVSDSLSQEITIVTDSFDNIYVAWSDPTDVGDLGGTDRDIFYNVYDEASSTWKGMSLVTEDSSLVSLEPCLYVDSKDYIHLVWTDNTDIYGAGSDYDLFYKKFLSSLSTWSSTQVVSTESNDHSRDGRMCIDSEDSIHVVWYDESDYLGAGFDLDVFYKSYNSLISSWTITEVLSVYADAASAIPDIAVDDSDTLHVTWEDLTDYGGIVGSDWDIFYQHKDKDSNQWSQLALVSLDADANSFVPRILIDKYNHIHFSWYDNTDYLSSGTDFDVFYRKFVGPPEATILTPFDPNIIEIGNLTLMWEAIPSAERYKVFRDNSYIYSTSSLSPIATVTELQFTDTLDTNGIYFYAVIATNRYGDSDPSNIESIEILDTTEQLGLFQSFSIGEILILVGIIAVTQLVLTTIVVVIFRTKLGKK